MHILEPLLAASQVCISRKLEPGPKQGLEAKHPNVGCRCPKHQLNHLVNCLPSCSVPDAPCLLTSQWWIVVFFFLAETKTASFFVSIRMWKRSTCSRSGLIPMWSMSTALMTGMRSGIWAAGPCAIPTTTTPASSRSHALAWWCVATTALQKRVTRSTWDLQSVTKPGRSNNVSGTWQQWQGTWHLFDRLYVLAYPQGPSQRSVVERKAAATHPACWEGSCQAPCLPELIWQEYPSINIFLGLRH